MYEMLEVLKRKKFVTLCTAISMIGYACYSWYSGSLPDNQAVNMIGEALLVLGIGRKIDRTTSMNEAINEYQEDLKQSENFNIEKPDNTETEG